MLPVASFKAKDLSLQSVLLLSSLPLPAHPQGPTAKDLYDALEERDQQMRQAQAKGKGGTLVGVCADMCPEKERYLREYQRRLSRFEMLPGTEGVSDQGTPNGRACRTLAAILLLPFPPLPSPPLPFPLMQLPNPSVDHSTAVKEYSKSAADQVGESCIHTHTDRQTHTHTPCPNPPPNLPHRRRCPWPTRSVLPPRCSSPWTTSW